jgi:hypothetical protein
MFNESLNEQQWTEIRGYAAKNLAAYLENGMEDEAVSRLRLAQSTFSKQYSHSPQMAQRKYTEWLKRFGDALGKHPRLKGWSQEELQARLEEMGRYGEETRGRVRSDTIDLIKGQMRLKGGLSGTFSGQGMSGQGFGGEGFGGEGV